MSISAITTISGREFAHNLAGAKRAARTGPVLITDRGQPTFALLAIEDYRRLAGAGFPQRTLLEVMESLPATPEVALEEVRLQGHPRAAELD